MLSPDGTAPAVYVSLTTVNEEESCQTVYGPVLSEDIVMA